MATPVYSGGACLLGRGDDQRGGSTSSTAGNGWVNRVGSLLGRSTPRYSGPGQPSLGSNGSGTPAYMPAPSTCGPADDATTTPQATASVIVVRN